MPGVIVQNVPHPLEGLQHLLAGAAQGFDKTERRKKVDPSTAHLPLQQAEGITAQLAQRQALDALNPEQSRARELQARFMNEIFGSALGQLGQGQGGVAAPFTPGNPGPVPLPQGQPPGFGQGQLGNQLGNQLVEQLFNKTLGLPQQPAIMNLMTEKQKKDYVQRLATGIQSRTQDPEALTTIQLDNSYVDSKTKKLVKSSLPFQIQNKYVNTITNIERRRGSNDPQQIWANHIHGLPGGQGDTGEKETNFFGGDALAKTADVLEALPDFVTASVLLNKQKPTDAVDEYVDLWETERDKRGALRNDVVPDLPEPGELNAMKIEAVLDYIVDPDIQDAVRIEAFENRDNPTALAEIWNELKAGISDEHIGR